VSRSTPSIRRSARDHEHRDAGDTADEALDERERRRVGPVQILDHRNQGPRGGDGLEEPGPGGERLIAIDARRPLQPHQWGDPGPQPGALRRIADQLAESARQLGVPSVGRIGLQDPDLLLEEFPDGPERDALTVGETSAPTPLDAVALLRDSRPKLGYEPALADARTAHDRYQVRGALPDDSPEGFLEGRSLGLPADEPRPARPGRR